MLTEEEKAICSQTGVSPEDYIKTKTDDMKLALIQQNPSNKEGLDICRAMGIDPLEYFATNTE